MLLNVVVVVVIDVIVNTLSLTRPYRCIIVQSVIILCVRGRKMKTRWKEAMRMQMFPTKDDDLTRLHWSANESYDCGMNRGELLLIAHNYLITATPANLAGNGIYNKHYK